MIGKILKKIVDVECCVTEIKNEFCLIVKVSEEEWHNLREGDEIEISSSGTGSSSKSEEQSNSPQSSQSAQRQSENLGKSTTADAKNAEPQRILCRGFSDAERDLIVNYMCGFAFNQLKLEIQYFNSAFPSRSLGTRAGENK